jgi:hypothetical protein
MSQYLSLWSEVGAEGKSGRMAVQVVVMCTEMGIWFFSGQARFEGLTVLLLKI